MNKVFLIGRLTKDLSMKTTSSGKEYCLLTLAIDKPKKNEKGEKITDFISVFTFGQIATYVSTYGHKGDLVQVECHLATSTTERNGQKETKLNVVAEQLSIIVWSNKNKDNKNNNNSNQEEDFDFNL